MTSAPPDRHLTCSICSQLRDWEHALQHGEEDADNTYLPAAASRLELVGDIRPSHPGLYLERCPECGTYYLSCSIYEFLVGYGGSYDEYFLARLTDETAADYRAGRRSGPLPGME